MILPPLVFPAWSISDEEKKSFITSAKGRCGRAEKGARPGGGCQDRPEEPPSSQNGAAPAKKIRLRPGINVETLFLFVGDVKDK